MSEYVSKIALSINGQEITDFNSVEEKEIDLRAPVHLMNKTGHVNKTARYGASVDYVVPSDAPEFDFASVVGGTLTIDKLNGVRVTFTGVAVTKIGATKYDGEKEATRSIELSAEHKVEE